MGRVPACLPISSRKRTVVRLRRPHALSLSVNALRHRMHQKRRLCSTNSTICPRNGTSRLQRGRTSCCLTHIVPQCGHFSPFFVAITSTRSFPSACTSCLRIHRPSNSKGTMIPCVWFGSSSVICWLGIACPPGLPGVLFLPNPTKDKLVVQFSSNFTLKDGEPEVIGLDLLPVMLYNIGDNNLYTLRHFDQHRHFRSLFCEICLILFRKMTCNVSKSFIYGIFIDMQLHQARLKVQW